MEVNLTFILNVVILSMMSTVRWAIVSVKDRHGIFICRKNFIVSYSSIITVLTTILNIVCPHLFTYNLYRSIIPHWLITVLRK